MEEHMEPMMSWDAILRTSYYTISTKKAEAVVGAFILHIPDRIRALTDWMRDRGDADWTPDYSDDSLLRIGQQVKRRIAAHPGEPAEVEINPRLPATIKESVRESIVSSWQELSSKDEHLAVDIGIYLAECVRIRASFGDWRRCPDKGSVDCNYPMLGMTRNYGINPFVVGKNILMNIVDGTRDSSGFVKVREVLVAQAMAVQKKQINK